MCNTCNVARNNNDIDALITMMDEIEAVYTTTYRTHPCWKNGDVYLGSIELEDEHEARTTLAVELGMWDTYMQHNKPTPIGDSPDQEDMQYKAHLVAELQARMDKGMTMIQECTTVLENAKKGKRLPYKVFMAWVERRRALWTHWFKLKDEKVALANHKAVWAMAYKLEEGEELGEYDPIKHKRECESVDSRMLTSDEAYFQGHMEEQAELFAYVG